MPQIKSMSPSTNSKPSPAGERQAMALILEGKHGQHAAEVAEFFASVHQELGDEARATAWTTVAGIVRARETARVSV